jgi:predicted ArsR family transcriptional regulator
MSTSPPGRHRAHEALSVPSRVRLLDALRRAGGPLDVRSLAEDSGLHVNTVRFHLDVLCRAGLAHRDTDRPHGRGRPRAVYRAGHPAGPADPYAVLAAVLAANWAPTAAERAARAEDAGRAMAATRAAPTEVAGTAEEALDRVGALFTELGFEPEIDADGPVVRLHACPYREVAVEHPDVVCALHLGLLRGLLADDGAPLQVVGLHPFVEPDLCVAELERTRPADG